MKKNTKIILGSVIGIAVLGAATLALVLTQPKSDNADSGTSSSKTVSVTDYTADDISTLTISNESGEYTINRLGKEKWGIDSIPEALANSSAYSTAMSSAGGIGAKQVVEENATDLAKYGFDKPTATVKMTFKDNKAEDITCLIGIKYEGENSWYVKTDKSDTVYLVANAGVSFAMNSELSYVNKSTLTAAYDSEKDKVNRVRIQRKDLDKDIVLDKLPEETEKKFSSTYVAYEMSSHNNILADDELDKKVIYGLFGISASDVFAVSPTDEQKKQAGLDDPYCTVTMVSNKETVTKLTLGSAVYTVTKNDETGEEIKTITGYYGMLSGKDAIYVFSPDSLPWLTATPENMLYKLFLTPYIYYLDGVTIYDSDRKAYDFTITGDADKSSFTYEGKEVDSAKFKAFYQYLLSAYAEQIYLDDLTGDNKFIAGVTYDHREEGKENDIVEFYASESDRTCIIVVNGDVRYKVRQIYATRLLENLNALLSGGEIVSEF